MTHVPETGSAPVEPSGHAAVAAADLLDFPASQAPLSGWARFAGAVLSVLWVAELAWLLTRWPPAALVARVALVVFLALAFWRASRHVRALFVVVLALCGLIASVLGHLGAWWEGLGQAQIFGAFLPALLLLRATAQHSPYAERLRAGTASLSAQQATNWTLAGAHLVGAVLSVGAMGVLAIGLGRGVDEDERARRAAAAVRGLGTAVMWSPFFVAMGFATQRVPAVALWQAMLAGAGVAAIGLIGSVRLYTPDLTPAQLGHSLRLLRPLLAPVAVVFGAVLALSAWGMGGLQAIALALPLVCGLYLLTRGPAVGAPALRATFGHFARLGDEMLVVAGASMLGAAVVALPAAQALMQGIQPGQIHGGVLLASLVVGLFVLGQLGVHPMIGAGVLLPVIAGAPFGVHPVALVAGTVFAWGLVGASSVWQLPIATASAAFGVPIARLWNRQAWRFTLRLGAAGLVYLVLLNAMLQP
ncbi:MAG: hypothetical protein ACOYLV_16370 [Rubrivivax sp.]